MSMVKRDHDVVEFDEEKIQIIKKMYAKDCSDSEFEVFLHIARKVRLDPVIKQIYPVKYGTVMTTQTSIDGLRLIADRTGKYMPGREPTYTYKDNRLFSATSYVKKLGPDGQWHEVAATAMLSEYAKQNLWKTMPHVMLAKCAESAALRKAFPHEMCSIYSPEEMEQASALPPPSPTQEEKTITVTYPVITQEQAKIIDDLIADDVEYRNRVLKGCKVANIDQIPAEMYGIVLERATLQSQKRLEQEMKTIEVTE